MKNFVKGSFINTKFFIQDNKLTLIFITLFTVGCLLGTLSLYVFKNNSENVTELLGNYFNENASLSVIELFSRNIVSSFLYLGIMYIGGLCAIGLPIVGIIPIVKGIAIGQIISYQYVYYGIKGFLYSLVIILLPNALLLAVFTCSYVEGMYMSLTVSNGIFNGKPRQVKYNCSFTTFTKRYLIFSVVIIVISLLEAVLSNVFSGVLS